MRKLYPRMTNGDVLEVISPRAGPELLAAILEPRRSRLGKAKHDDVRRSELVCFADPLRFGRDVGHDAVRRRSPAGPAGGGSDNGLVGLH